MKLYNQDIKRLQKYFATLSFQELNSKDLSWPVLEKEELLLRLDTAFELGGGSYKAVSGVAFTADEKLVPTSGVYLSGPDLSEITSDCSYARITLIRLKKDCMQDEDGLHRVLRKIEYTRFHLFLKGYMMRISSAKEREPVRVSKAVVSKLSTPTGAKHKDDKHEVINFSKVGSRWIEAYKKHPDVEEVAVYFVTLPSADYVELQKISHRFEQITDSTNHIFDGLAMDCNVCNLKEICDEVEGLKELHFSKINSF